MAVNAANPAQSTGQESIRIPVAARQLAIGALTVDTVRGIRVHKTDVEQPVEKLPVENRRLPITQELHITRVRRGRQRHESVGLTTG